MDRVLAIAGLRFRLLSRRVRGVGGALNLIGAALLAAIGVLFAGGAAVGFGLMIGAFVADGAERTIRIGFLIVFYVALFLGVVLPLVRGAIDEGFDASPFVIFPVSRRGLYGMTVTAAAAGTDHLLYYPTFLAVFVSGSLLPAARPLVGLALVLLLACVLVAWSNLLALILVSVMRARRVREIVVIGGLVLLIVISFVPAFFEDPGSDLQDSLPQLRSILELALRGTSVLPPSIAAEGMTRIHTGAPVYPSLVGLTIWAVSGLALGFLIFDRYHLAERTLKARSPGRSREPSWIAAICTFDAGPLASLPSDVRAIASKELRYLLRSVVGRFVLLISPLFVVLVVFGLRQALVEEIFGLDPERLLLFGVVFYTVLFSNNFVYNAFAWDGDGLKSYFLAPAPATRVLLAKNVGVWLYNLLLLVLVLVAWSLIAGPPGPVTLLSVLFFYAAALVTFTAVGNFLSIRFPVPRDISTARNQPAQLSIVASLVVLFASGIVFGPFLAVPSLLGWELLQPVVLAALFGLTVVGYRFALRPAGLLFEQRREQLMQELKSAR